MANYSLEQRRRAHPALAVVDIRAEQAAVTEFYRNQVLVDVNTDCMRLSVFEGEYRWHHHPDSDELFLPKMNAQTGRHEHPPRSAL